MKTTKYSYKVCVCLNCNFENVVTDSIMAEGQCDCLVCGYSNEFTDIRVQIDNREWTIWQIQTCNTCGYEHIIQADNGLHVKRLALKRYVCTNCGERM